ncbi:DUF2752 domain-containing protein [bacterium SCSIO 12741]|nr:DUF2752 domain-containing protein [bacterium SCSIO 12741]
MPSISVLRKSFHLELILWPAALLALFFYNPYGHGEGYFSLCLFHHLDLPCLGCGLGHSISFLLHGDWASSWSAHWFGAPALGILVYRTVHLAFQEIKQSKHSHNYGKS